MPKLCSQFVCFSHLLALLWTVSLLFKYCCMQTLFNGPFPDKFGLANFPKFLLRLCKKNYWRQLAQYLNVFCHPANSTNLLSAVTTQKPGSNSRYWCQIWNIIYWISVFIDPFTDCWRKGCSSTFIPAFHCCYHTDASTDLKTQWHWFAEIMENKHDVI